MERVYEHLIKEHFDKNRQMAFIAGPRQVGKTTSACAIAEKINYLSWDKQADRRLLIKGPDSVAEFFRLSDLQQYPPFLVFDEIHKYSKWKSFLKGFFDAYGSKSHITVTGSARMDIYKHGGDSLMGRYFLYRMHPLTVREVTHCSVLQTEISAPARPDTSTLDTLLEFGGFPEPFLKADKRFYNKWKRLRLEQFFHEDVRDITKVSDIYHIELLAELLKNCAGQLINMSSLAAELNVSVDTVRRWIALLEKTYFSFIVRPWFKNVPKSLRKQPKIYLWDWSMVDNAGMRRENMVASHLYKAVQFWTDMGLGDYGLYYLRDKEKREVDFMVTKDRTPFFIVEVKSSTSAGINPALRYFQKITGARHAFQAAFNMEFIERDCFEEKAPVRVPVLTLLSQLV